MHQRDELERTVLVEHLGHHRRVDGLVVRNPQLVDVGAVLPQPVAEPGRVHPGDQVQAPRARLDQRTRRPLEPDDRLSLHQHDVAGRAIQLRQQTFSLAEALQKRRVVVEDDRRPERREDARGGHRRARR